jgi:flagellar biosynthesis GTPase FlhF
MELKRIIARDSRTANEKAIQLYGPDVLIISSQRVDQQTELIVAVDETLAPVSEKPAVSRVEVKDFKPDNDQFLPFSEVFQTASGQAMPARAVAEPEAEPVVSAAPMVSAAPVAPAAHYEQQRSHEIVDMLRQEMAALRQEFALSRQMQPWQQTQGLSPDIQKLSVAMQEVGMPVALRTLLTDSIGPLQTLEEAWTVVERLLVNAISRPARKVPESGVHALCGPSGAGKTSMVGRLAYAASQTHGADKQVMISYGDQRPGAWSQIQLLASQAGAACFRAADMAMLQTLLDDLHGKTIWIDTPGTDFAAQAQQLQLCAGVGIHAVLPVDATVTSVQKILQNQEIRWSSVMLTKADEAAYPWPLIKGLCDQSLAVSCMAEDSKINMPPLPFGAERLVALAMTPLQALLPEIQHLGQAAQPVKAVRKPRVKKEVLAPFDIQPKPRAVRSRAVKAPLAAKAVHG